MKSKENDEDEVTEDSPGTFLIDPYNYAKDPAIAARALEWVKNVSEHVFQDREALNQKYLQFYNIYRAKFDIRYYNGTCQVYIPQVRKNVEFYVARLKQALFPTDDVFEVEPVSPEEEESADIIRLFLKYQLDKKVKIKLHLPKFLRQLVMYGWSVVKVVWEREEKKVVGLSKKTIPVTTKQFNAQTGKTEEVPTGQQTVKIYEEEKELLLKNNPTFDVRDVFGFYIYPSTANSIQEAYGVIDLTKQTAYKLRQRAKNGDYENVEELLNLKPDPSAEFCWTKASRSQIDGLSTSEDLDEIPIYTLVEYAGKFNLGTEEEPDEHEVIITTGQNKVCLQVRKNQAYDQESPYLQARMTELIDEAYPTGLIEPLASMQYYINDIFSQNHDSVSYSLNPIVKYDPGRVININSIVFAPGAMWALSDPDAVKFDRAPDVSATAMNMMNTVKALIEEYPGVQNIPMTGRKAATHIAAIQEEFSLPIADLSENIEEQVMSPLLKKYHMLNQQYISDEEVFYVTGKSGIKEWKRLSPEQLVGDYHFYWRGSNQASNLHVKNRQMMEFLNVAMPAIPYLQSQGKQLNVDYVLERIWKDGFALDGLDKLFTEGMEDEVPVDPNQENILLSVGKFVPISAGEDDQAHIQIHQPLLQHPDPYVRKAVTKHIMMHSFRLQQMQQMMTMGKGTPSNIQSEGAGEVPGERDLEGLQP